MPAPQGEGPFWDVFVITNWRDEMNWMKTAAVGASMLSAVAVADTVEMSYEQVAGGTNAMRVRVAGEGTFYAGHMVHTFTSGSRAGQSFSTFCIDVREFARTGATTYEIIDLADAPQPGQPYGQAKADAVSAVVANAIALGWIGRDLQASTESTDYLGKMGVIQAAIWGALGYNIRDNSSRTSDALNHYYDILLDDDTFDSSLRTRGLRAAVASNQQDMLYIVPLPPAAFAGAGMLVLAAGVRQARRRR